MSAPTAASAERTGNGRPNGPTPPQIAADRRRTRRGADQRRPRWSWWPTGCRSTWRSCPTAAPRPGRRRAAWSPRWRPILSRRQGAWIGWPGSPDVTLEPTTTDGLSLHPGHAVQRRRRRLLRGLLQRDAVAAVPRRGRRIAVPPRLVGGLPAGQRAVRRGGRRARGARRDRLGARLPAAAGPAVAPPAAAGRADRLLPAHPVPAGRAVHAAAVADPDRRRACSAPT